MQIAVDFDGTIVRHRYPEIGEEIPGALDTLKKLNANGHRLILWTVREGELLDEAVEWCRERGLEFYAINKDYPEEEKSHEFYSRKLKVDVWIDDRNIGGLPPWPSIYRMIEERKPFSFYSVLKYTADSTQHEMMERYRKPVKRSFLSRLFGRRKRR